DQVEQLKFVRACMADGATAADAHRLLAERDEGGPPVAARADAPDRLVILLADCDPYAAQFQEHFLRAEGFEVEVALSQQTARESFSQNAPPVIDLRSASPRSSGRVGMDRAVHGGPFDSGTAGAESNSVPSRSNAAMPSARTWWNRMSIGTCPAGAPVSSQISHRGCVWSNGRSFSSTQVANSASSPPPAGTRRVLTCRVISKLASSTQTGAPKPGRQSL